MNNLIDTHCHLYDKAFDEDRLLASKRAQEKGLVNILMPNVDRVSLPRMLDLHQSNPTFFRPMLGLHPCSVTGNYKEELSFLKSSIDKATFIAIGEIGIDKYWSLDFINEQIDAFEQQIDWAIQLDLPIVIHCRDAYPEILDILEQKKHTRLRGVLHCFTGSQADADRLIDMGFYLGLGGVLTFKNGGLAEWIQSIPLDRILLETDAPYLAPTPYRGKRNEPSYIVEVAQKLADIHQSSLEAIAKKTTENAVKLFNL
ncbi:MAG: TatD family hydrolase [Chitinophagales bacterium]